jgi:hypothetical protein
LRPVTLAHDQAARRDLFRSEACLCSFRERATRRVLFRRASRDRLRLWRFTERLIRGLAYSAKKVIVRDGICLRTRRVILYYTLAARPKTFLARPIISSGLRYGYALMGILCSFRHVLLFTTASIQYSFLDVTRRCILSNKKRPRSYFVTSTIRAL